MSLPPSPSALDGTNSESTTTPLQPQPLIRITKTSSPSSPRYLVFSPADVMTLRRTHNMCSVLSGTTHLAPSQNAFLSLPLQLMVEEARLLLQKGVAYVVDGNSFHHSSLASMSAVDSEKRKEYVREMRERRGTIEFTRAEERRKHQEEVLRKRVEAGKMGKKNKGKGKNAAAAVAAAASKDTDGKGDGEPSAPPVVANTGLGDEGGEVSLVAPELEPPKEETPTPMPKIKLKVTKLSLTLSSSVPEMMDPPISSSSWSESKSKPRDEGGSKSASYTALVPSYASTSPDSIPEPRAHALYAYIHSRGYFLTPGIRFGCNFSVYPGDPMRFHAHFLATSFGWDQEISMLEIVGPGRLATAVKKGLVIGGEKPREEGDEEKDEEPGARVRAFSIEWAGF
ncbi:SEN34 subunit of tRNA-splicing endonuclease [Zalerion maritima]|uniref:tRNA-intron lyase n=1 Tax=Zalerion maritima TaxID=339359 RepID=A0AAD5S2Q2_9PEZI|nr:SEN34 subunit of tRNA-splicing endonuclease [Zalerion maritima]